MSEQRAGAREALRHGGFDLVVIGGGILGIATTWAAARSGLRKRGERVTGVELRDRVDGDEFGVGASVVNSTGPWLDHLRRMEDPSAAPSIRLSKGSHLVMRTDQPWRAAMAIPVDDVRVSFAIPWEGHLLPGPRTRRTTAIRPRRRSASTPRRWIGASWPTRSRVCGCCPVVPETRATPSGRP
jgi:glycerol-3-phosphate dehydrogenase